MNAAAATRHSVLCVDDNPYVREALRLTFGRSGALEWLGALPDATDLLARAQEECPSIVLLDLDMPGPDPFEVLVELTERCPDCRTVVFTGHVRRDLIDRAIEAGAWGYVSKNDGDEQLLLAIQRVLEDQFAFSPAVRATLDT